MNVLFVVVVYWVFLGYYFGFILIFGGSISIKIYVNFFKVMYGFIRRDIYV